MLACARRWYGRPPALPSPCTFSSPKTSRCSRASWPTDCRPRGTTRRSPVTAPRRWRRSMRTSGTSWCSISCCPASTASTCSPRWPSASARRACSCSRPARRSRRASRRSTAVPPTSLPSRSRSTSCWRASAPRRARGRSRARPTGALARCGSTTRRARSQLADGRRVELSAREYEVLAYLLRTPGAVVSRERLLNAIWSYQFDPRSNVVDVCVGRLRRKLAGAARDRRRARRRLPRAARRRRSREGEGDGGAGAGSAARSRRCRRGRERSRRRSRALARRRPGGGCASGRRGRSARRRAVASRPRCRSPRRRP